MKRIAINGLGRIGRLILRRFMDNAYQNFTVVAVNDPMSANNLTYLLKRDSVHGRANFTPRVEEKMLCLNETRLPLFSETDPAQLPWQELQIDTVLECSGHFTTRAGADRHLRAGAKRVLISAPSPDADLTLVLGVNENDFDAARHFIVSNASCTTNSLAPVLKVLDEHFSIESVLMTTVHAYTSSQTLVDMPARKPARGRAGAINIIPTSTGADLNTELVLPQLKGRVSALALRVPVPNGSLTDISAGLKKPVTVEKVNEVLETAANNQMQGILAYSDEELVSSDIIGDPHSAIVLGPATRVVQKHHLKLQVWYDNEYGYACRCLDLLELLPF